MTDFVRQRLVQRAAFLYASFDEGASCILWLRRGDL